MGVIQRLEEAKVEELKDIVKKLKGFAIEYAPFPLIPLTLIISSFFFGNSPILGASLFRLPRGGLLVGQQPH
jgi:hypothetical protein